MKFLCKCGYSIHDTTDCLSYKGTLIADAKWYLSNPKTKLK